MFFVEPNAKFLKRIKTKAIYKDCFSKHSISQYEQSYSDAKDFFAHFWSIFESYSLSKSLNNQVPGDAFEIIFAFILDYEDIEIISDLLIKYRIEAVIISNTTEKNRENLININKLEKGGLSGKPLENKSNITINKFYKNLKNKIKIIGVGGVDSGKSAYEKILNGASLIQLYTGMVYQGPNISNKINEELIVILKKEGFENISEAIGVKN